MKSASAFVVAVVALLLLVSGCSSVSTPYPVGQVLSHDQGETFNGSWKHNHQIVHIRHISDGETVLAVIEWDSDAGRYVARQHKAVFGRLGEDYALSLANNDEPGRYFFVLARLTDDDHLILWPANVKTFANAVNAGQLQGSVRQGEHDTIDVRITSAKADLEAYLTQQPISTTFELEKPSILTRLTPQAP